MSFEESVLLEVMRGVKAVKLDAILIGNAAAAVQGVPVTTQDVDLFVRETPRTDEKIEQLLKTLGNHLKASRPFEPMSRMIRIEGLAVDVDLVFELSSHVRFESVKARCQVITIEGVSLRVAHLNDIIAAKRAAGRPKDLATLPLPEEFVRVQETIKEERDSSEGRLS